jgi:serine/threonine-protein kinase
VAEALAYAHRQSVVHRDIKPANIMYEPDSDTVKVTDFGIARITDSSKTKTGLVLGTPSFMSPEQIAGKKVDGRSDLYSLGVMLFQMLTGVLPFRGDSMAELMYKIANEEAPDVRIVRKDIPDHLAQVLARSLAKKPEQRYQDGEQFAADLRAVIAEMTGAPAPAGAPLAIPVRPAPAAEPEKTVAFGAASAAAPAADADRTVVLAAPQPASAAPAFEATVVAAAQPQPAAPGYDATQIMQPPQEDEFAKTAVMSRPAASVPPGNSPGKTDLEA